MTPETYQHLRVAIDEDPEELVSLSVLFVRVREAARLERFGEVYDVMTNAANQVRELGAPYVALDILSRLRSLVLEDSFEGQDYAWLLNAWLLNASLEVTYLVLQNCQGRQQARRQKLPVYERTGFCPFSPEKARFSPHRKCIRETACQHPNRLSPSETKSFSGRVGRR